MTMKYYPDVDMLRIVLRETPFEAHGEDTNDANITLLHDREHQLAEIEVAHASRRVDLDHLRTSSVFKEIAPANAG